MLKFSKTAMCLTILSVLTFTGCSDDGDHDDPIPTTSTKEITLTPSLGKITQGRAVLRNAITRQAIVDIKDIGANGTVTFTVDSSKLKDPIIAEILPTIAGKLVYADEAITNELVTINAAANTPILRVATTITANKTNLGVTALTEAALNYALSLNAQVTQANLDAANKIIKDQLKLTKFNITDAPAIVGLNDFSPLINTALLEQQRAYAAYLATLAQETKRNNPNSVQPAFDILQALSKDLSDGKFDAKQGATVLATYNNAWIQAWSNWVTTFYDSIFKLQNAGDLTAWLNAFNAVKPNIPTPTPITTATPIRTVDGVAEYACADESKLKSATGSALNIDFINQSGGAINIDWITQSGTLSRYSTGLASGQTYSIKPTYVTHPWKITDSKGVCKGIFVATTATNKTLTIKANEIVIGKDTTPVIETCASKKLPVGKLSDLTDYQGDYKNQGKVVFNLNTATAQVVANGTNANIKEVCGANVQSNGTNFYVITDKGYVTLFKDNAAKYTAESADFSGFYGEKASTTTPTLCESNGADDKLGFKNAPNDFCSFTKATSVAITSPDIYTFFNADKKENVKVTVEGTTVKSVQIENNTYAWACGVGSLPACTGVTVKDGQINSKPAKSFYFNNTLLKAVSGTTQDLTIQNNSLLMYVDNTTTPTPTTSCTNSTNQWGCVTITGLASPLIFEHNSTGFIVPRVGQFNAANKTVNVQFNHKSKSALDDMMTITKANAGSTYISFSLGSIEWYQCGTYASEASVCPGVTLDPTTRTLTLHNVKLTKMTDVSTVLTANGVLKF